MREIYGKIKTRKFNQNRNIIMARVTKEGMSVEFNQVREVVRKELIKRYGSVAKFLHSEKGKELGGYKMKVYLYSTGPVNFDFISGLCKFLGIGGLSRKIIVSRSFSYRLDVEPEFSSEIIGALGK